MHTPPGPSGLYDPRFEHDSCGVSFVANIKGVRSHELVHTGLVALTNLEHRGATGAEPDTGDGAGILVQVPDRFLRSVLGEQGVDLPADGRLRRRHGVPAVRRRRRRQGAGGDREHHERRGPHGAGMAGRADRPELPRGDVARRDADVQAAAHQRHGRRDTHLLARTVSTTPASSTTPAGSPSSPTSRACAATSWCTPASSPSPTSSTAAPPAPSPTPVTAPASSSRSPTASCASVLAEQGVADLPPAGAYAVGMAFLPADHVAAEKAQAAIENIMADEGLTVVAWRDVPVDPSCLGATVPGRHAGVHASSSSPIPAGSTGIDLDRKAFLARKRVEHELDAEFATYFPSLSSRTLVYKGMLTTPQLAAFFPDLLDERFESAPAARAQPLLDEHVPVVAARPPVPLRRPQRRDQHRPGQPELDARPRGDGRRLGAARRRHGPSRSARPARPTRPASTRSSSCSTSAAARSTTPC